MSGCLSGSVFTADESGAEAIAKQRYRVKGPDKLLKEMRDNQSYRLEITGALDDTAIVDQNGGDATWTKGKNRITVGTHAGGAEKRSVTEPTVTVKSYRKLTDRCRSS